MKSSRLSFFLQSLTSALMIFALFCLIFINLNRSKSVSEAFTAFAAIFLAHLVSAHCALMFSLPNFFDTTRSVTPGNVDFELGKLDLLQVDNSAWNITAWTIDQNSVLVYNVCNSSNFTFVMTQGNVHDGTDLDKLFVHHFGGRLM